MLRYVVIGVGVVASLVGGYFIKRSIGRYWRHRWRGQGSGMFSTGFALRKPPATVRGSGLLKVIASTSRMGRRNQRKTAPSWHEATAVLVNWQDFSFHTYPDSIRCKRRHDQGARWERFSPSVEIMQAKAAIQTFICFVAILLQFRDSSIGVAHFGQNLISTLPGYRMWDMVDMPESAGVARCFPARRRVVGACNPLIQHTSAQTPWVRGSHTPKKSIDAIEITLVQPFSVGSGLIQKLFRV